jgi:hypothetical protein
VVRCLLPCPTFPCGALWLCALLSHLLSLSHLFFPLLCLLARHLSQISSLSRARWLTVLLCTPPLQRAYALLVRAARVSAAEPGMALFHALQSVLKRAEAAPGEHAATGTTEEEA